MPALWLNRRRGAGVAVAVVPPLLLLLLLSPVAASRTTPQPDATTVIPLNEEELADDELPTTQPATPEPVEDDGGGACVNCNPIDVDSVPYFVRVNRRFQFIGGDDDDDTMSRIVRPAAESSTWCGGTLIRSNIVLTAAHCDTAAGPLYVQIGRQTVSDQNYETYNVVAQAKHPGYLAPRDAADDDNIGGIAFDNDIMLLKLDRDVVGAEVRGNLATLWSSFGGSSLERAFLGKDLIIMGFGRTKWNSRTSDDLQAGVVQLVPHDECSRLYNGAISPSMICAIGKTIRGGQTVNVDTCGGDSGGPLIGESNGNIYVFGITSFGPSKCALSERPGVYTNVEMFIDWIGAQIMATFSSEGSGDWRSV